MNNNYNEMKRLLVAFIAMTLSICSFAQEHMTFKGVPIDGTRKEFVAKMEEKHFTLLGTQEDITLLQGDFAGNKNCTIGVTTLTDKDVVSTIAVILPEKDTWSALEGDYISLKEMLTEKYGKPEKSVEEFQNRTPRDDNEKIHELMMDRCNYGTLFTTEKGSIELMISHNGMISCFVLLRYIDKINGEAVRAAAMEDL